MLITWKDGITTMAASGAFLLERAHSHQWNWPVVSNVRWLIVIITILAALVLFFGYVMDRIEGRHWTLIADGMIFTTVAFSGLALYHATHELVMLLTLNTMIFWVLSLGGHTAVVKTDVHSV